MKEIDTTQDYGWRWQMVHFSLERYHRYSYLAISALMNAASQTNHPKMVARYLKQADTAAVQAVSEKQFAQTIKEQGY